MISKLKYAMCRAHRAVLHTTEAILHRETQQGGACGAGRTPAASLCWTAPRRACPAILAVVLVPPRVDGCEAQKCCRIGEHRSGRKNGWFMLLSFLIKGSYIIILLTLHNIYIYIIYCWYIDFKYIFGMID